jgi:peptidoglycan/xylan/chitin deacetylase (PgdA/CDA1 family)
MSISRGKFLKELGKSLPGMVLGGGIATAAQTLLGKMSAASGTPLVRPPTISPTPRQDILPPRFISSGPSEGVKIALTFDDGPTPGVTDGILDILKERQIQATFFMIGSRIAAAPDLARRVLSEGHEAGNHTFTHAKLTTLPDDKVDAEIESTRALMQEALNYQAKWFRPPFGALRTNQSPLVQKAGLGVVLWSVDANDWSQPGVERIVEKILEQVKAGSIILCHDLHAQTREALPLLLDGLEQRDFELVSLTNLLSSTTMTSR